MKKTIFLTGSKGFIGSHLYAAIKGDYDVICGRYNELPPISVDYIIHLAATTTTSSEFNARLFEDNIVYASKIMSMPIRIIYASSTSSSELTNPYAYTKRYIEYLGQQHGNATGLRFFNVYGNGNNKGIVKKAIECANSGEKLPLMFGFQVRDFIYIDDVVRAIVDRLDAKPGIVDIGTGEGISILNVIKIISRVMGKQINTDMHPNVKTDMECSVANPGLPDCLSFEDGIKKMLNK